jgi:mannose-6-phosphate isomerase-like protein (cupin superfamily)
MKRFKLSDSGARGWFIGDFESAVYRTKDFEVTYQLNPRGKPDTHVHKQITEITLVISGRAVVNGELFEAGDIHVLYPNDISQIEYLEDTQVVTIKTPSIPTDKFML